MNDNFQFGFDLSELDGSVKNWAALAAWQLNPRFCYARATFGAQVDNLIDDIAAGVAAHSEILLGVYPVLVPGVSADAIFAALKNVIARIGLIPQIPTWVDFEPIQHVWPDVKTELLPLLALVGNGFPALYPTNVAIYTNLEGLGIIKNAGVDLSPLWFAIAEYAYPVGGVAVEMKVETVIANAVALGCDAEKILFVQTGDHLLAPSGSMSAAKSIDYDRFVPSTPIAQFFSATVPGSGSGDPVVTPPPPIVPDLAAFEASVTQKLDNLTALEGQELADLDKLLTTPVTPPGPPPVVDPFNPHAGQWFELTNPGPNGLIPIFKTADTNSAKSLIWHENKMLAGTAPAAPSNRQNLDPTRFVWFARQPVLNANLKDRTWPDDFADVTGAPCSGWPGGFILLDNLK